MAYLQGSIKHKLQTYSISCEPKMGGFLQGMVKYLYWAKVLFLFPLDP